MIDQCIWEQNWDVETKCNKRGTIVKAGFMTSCDNNGTWTRDNKYGKLLSEYNKNGGKGVRCPFCGRPIAWYDTRPEE